MHRKPPLLPPLVCLAIVVLLVAPVTSSSSSETGPLLPPSRSIENALTYLLDQVDEEGCIGGARVTAWATMAVAAAGYDPQAPAPSGANLVDGLRACEPDRAMQGEELTAIQRHLLAIVAAGEEPNAFNGRDWEQEVRDHATSQGFFEPGRPNSLNNDIFGILALLAAGASPSDTAIQNASDRLLANQNDDGGWSHTAPALGSASDTDMTGAAITALVQAGRLAKDSQAMQEALDFLEQRATDTNGSDHPGCLSTRHDLARPDPDSTAWALLGLLSAHDDPRAPPWNRAQDPWQCLLSLQHEDGGFPASPDSAPSPWPTAYAILALTGSPFATVHPGMQRPQAIFTASSDPGIHQEVHLEAAGVPFASWRHEESGALRTGTLITWTPDRAGIHNFTVLLIDELGLARQTRYPVLVLPEATEEPVDPGNDREGENDSAIITEISLLVEDETTAHEPVDLQILPVDDDVSYRIDWGDGNLTGWTQSDAHHHTYHLPGTYTISVWSRTMDGPLQGPEQATITILSPGTLDTQKEPLIPREIPVSIQFLSLVALLAFAAIAHQGRGGAS